MFYRYSIRFNLGAGPNYLKWKVKDNLTNEVNFFDPDTTQFILTDCRLVNQKSTAMKIHNGEHKAVCAWVDARLIEVTEVATHNRPIMYNPRIAPYWRNSFGDNIDGMMFNKLATNGRQLFIHS